MTEDSARGVTVQVVIVCMAGGLFWPEGGQPACSDPDHEHSQHETHRHRTPVTLPSGALLWAASFDADDPYSRDTAPDFGLYLDERWAPPWDHTYWPWPDFGVPTDLSALRERLAEVLARAKAGDRVEIGCWGAHGRTGTALGCLAILDGHASQDAVRWVRTYYCERAIETAEQEAFVAAFESSYAIPRPPKTCTIGDRPTSSGG